MLTNVDNKVELNNEKKFNLAHLNSKMAIFQTLENDILFRTESTYEESLEHKQAMNNSNKLLCNANNLVYYSLAKNQDIYTSKKKLKENFKNVSNKFIFGKNQKTIENMKDNEKLQPHTMILEDFIRSILEGGNNNSDENDALIEYDDSVESQ